MITVALLRTCHRRARLMLLEDKRAGWGTGQEREGGGGRAEKRRSFK